MTSIVIKRRPRETEEGQVKMDADRVWVILHKPRNAWGHPPKRDKEGFFPYALISVPELRE